MLERHSEFICLNDLFLFEFCYDNHVTLCGIDTMNSWFCYISYNPISYRIGSCPALDWRNPPMIDMYRQISKRVCAKHNIPLIETNDIIGIMWDRAVDWCHYLDISRDMELTYILNRIFA